MRVLLFVAVGAGAGLLYQRLVGCRTGACPLTSHPVITMLYGAFMGYLAAG